MKYIIGQNDINWSRNRWVQKGYGFLEGIMPNCEYPQKKGYIGLYDRNTRRFIWFKIIKKCIDKFAYICSRRSKIKGYWHDLQRLKRKDYR